MKRFFLLLIFSFSLFFVNATEWGLVWSDEFDYSGEPDNSKWSFDTQGNDWDWGNNEAQNYTPKENRNAWVENGNLVIEARKESWRWWGDGETKQYTSARIISKNKGDWTYGKFEIRALLPKGRGMWPAIWMLPNDKGWPDGGEIDIMERLNGDSIAYQTVHSHYTFVLKEGKNPPQGSTGPIDPDDYNVYAVEILPDSLVFSINNRRTFSYPRIQTDKPGQYPFGTPFYLLVDMQIEGQWVGKADPKDYPVEMWIDWVKMYELKE